ncbi:MAG: PPC domain-containing DNA-binding protein [Dehalococcoidales bacterium]
MLKSINLLRLDHGQKLIGALSDYCQKKNISSAIILGIIGSLESVRFAKPRENIKQLGVEKGFGHDYEEFEGPWSVPSGQGSLSVFEGEKVFHIHLSLSSPKVGGEMIGGHLVEADVWNTLEIYIGEPDYQLRREFDHKIGMSALIST